jgi:hypothetical protein
MLNMESRDNQVAQNLVAGPDTAQLRGLVDDDDAYCCRAHRISRKRLCRHAEVGLKHVLLHIVRHQINRGMKMILELKGLDPLATRGAVVDAEPTSRPSVIHLFTRVRSLITLVWRNTVDIQEDDLGLHRQVAVA